MDALCILEWSGQQISVPLADFDFIQQVFYPDLPTLPGFRVHVALNMGPMVVRGMWYPYITSAPPSLCALACERWQRACHVLF